MNLRLTTCAVLLALPLLVPADALAATKKTPSANAPVEPPAQDTSLDNLKEATPPPVLACTGPFAKDTSHARLVTEFGAKNVVFKDVETSGDVLKKATVVFDDDPTKRVIIFWSDIKTRSKPSSVLVEAPSTWSGPGGIRNGLPLKSLEKINGTKFNMRGFGSIGGGSISDLKGPFADVAGGCTLTVRLEPGIANPLPPRFASITGDVSVSSTNVLLRRVRAQVSQWSIDYH